MLSGEVQISGVVESTAGGAPIISVEVPVEVDGQVKYVLAAGLSPEYLAELFRPAILAAPVVTQDRASRQVSAEY